MWQLLLMGFGKYLSVMDTLKAGKQQKRDMEDEAREIRRQAGVEQQVNLEQQLIERKEETRIAGQITSSAAGKGLRVSGSVSNFRNATVQNIEDRINFRSRRSVEKQTTMNLRANKLDRQARRVVKDAKWKAFSSILGGAADVGMGGYNMGLWGGKEDV